MGESRPARPCSQVTNIIVLQLLTIYPLAIISAAFSARVMKVSFHFQIKAAGGSPSPSHCEYDFLRSCIN